MLSIENYEDQNGGSKKRQAIISGAAVFVAIILVASIGFISGFYFEKQQANSEDNKCKLQAAIPTAAGAKQTSFISSKNNRTDLRMAAYLEVSTWKGHNRTEVRFMPLTLKEVVADIGPDRFFGQFMELKFDCASLSIEHEGLGQRESNRIVSSRLSPSSSDSGFSFCQLPMNNIVLYTNQYLICRQPKRYICNNTDWIPGTTIVRATLVITSIEVKMRRDELATMMEEKVLCE